MIDWIKTNWYSCYDLQTPEYMANSKSVECVGPFLNAFSAYAYNNSSHNSHYRIYYVPVFFPQSYCLKLLNTPKIRLWLGNDPNN